MLSRKWVAKPTFLLYRTVGFWIIAFNDFQINTANSMDQLVEKIREMIEPVFDQMDIYLVDIDLRGNQGSQVLSIFADTKSGISLDQITRLTREINEILDTTDVIDGVYRLEVSSPGIDRDLKMQWEFEKNIGRNLSVSYQSGDEPASFNGKLTEVTTDTITLVYKKESMQIPLNAILKARVQIKW